MSHTLPSLRETLPEGGLVTLPLGESAFQATL